MAGEPPEVRILRGSPTPEEEAALREAVLRLWREERAEARRGAGRSPWVRCARAEATGFGAADLRREPGAWRLGLRLIGLGLVSERRAGRGDAR
jgi:hypothetical protein